MEHLRHAQQGTALLLSLFITAIVAIIAFSILESEEIHIQRTQLSLTANQADWYAKGTQLWAAHLLTTDIYKKDNEETMPLIDWPKKMPVINLPNGEIHATLFDAQSLFNLNNLKTSEQQIAFKTLISQATQNQDRLSIDPLLRALIAWISPPGANSDVISENYYISHDPPYQIAHREFSSPTEARLVSGMTANLYNALSPYIIALPGETPLNINTAPAVLLATLGNGLDQNQVQQIIDARNKNEGFVNVTDLTGLPFMQEIKINDQALTTNSNYFLLRSDVMINHQQLTVFTLFNREKQDKQPAIVKLLWQSIGTL